MRAKAEIRLDDVGIFVRVVRTQSFSAAAREAGVPVSTVSRTVTRLEAALGTRLLERTTRSLRLTDAGRVYFDHAAHALDHLATGTDQLRERQSEPRGRVRILAPTWLAQAVARATYPFLATHPRVAVDLVFDQRAPDPVAGGFDIAIVAGKPADSSDFIAREIWRPSVRSLFASPRYLRVRGTPARIADLAHHDLIAFRSTEGFTTWTLRSGRAKRSHTFAPRLYTSEISVAQGAAVAGLGIALLPASLCEADVAKKRMVRVLGEWEGEQGGVHLLYRSHRALSAAVRGCLNYLLEGLPGTDPSRSAARGA